MRGQSPSLVWPATPLPVTGSTLLNGLQVYYKLENLNDSVGGLTLTDHGTVTFPAGKIGNCASFVSASSQYLSRADNAAFQMGTGDFAYAFWFKTTSTTDFPYLFGYGAVGATGYGSYIKNDGSGTGVRAWIGDPTNTAQSGAFHSWNDGNWHLVIVNHTRASNMIVYIDNATEDTADISARTGSVNNTNGFSIGARYDAAGFIDASVDEFGLWNRVLTGAERTELWNGGAGRTHPFT